MLSYGPGNKPMADSLEANQVKNPTESEATSFSAGDRLRLLLLGLLGYGVLSGVLALALAAVGLTILALAKLHVFWLLKIAWLPLVVVGIVLRALWVNLPEPQGVELDRKRFPVLFETLEGIRVQLRTPPVHRVVLTREFNAGLAQVPRLGILGWPRNTLVLGLPLMLVLRPESFRAVVAHELGHLSANHGAFGAWLYRIRQTWQRVLEGLMEQEAKLDFGLRSFFGWYVPYFEAYAFRLLRAQEYVADQCAAEITTARQTCETLVEVELLSGFARSHLTELMDDLVRHDPDPPRLLRRVQRTLWEGPSDEAGNRALALALQRPATPNDTHPSLTDRLAALDEQFVREAGVSWPTPGWGARSEGSAAKEFLGAELDGVLDRFDREWCEQNAQQWGHEHRVFQKRLRDLAELDRAALERELTREESWKRVHETVELRDPQAAIQVLRPFALSHADVPQVRFLLGKLLLLHCEDEAGIPEIEAAMAVDPRSIPAGCELIDRYLCTQHREEEVAAWRERARGLHESIAERMTLGDDDELLPHELDKEAQGRLRELFDRLPVQAVMMARKRVRHFPDYPVWILGYSVRTRSEGRNRRELEDAVGQQLRQALSEVGDLILFPLERRPQMIDALGAVESSIVYDE